MTNKILLDQCIGSLASVFNDKMSLYGMIRKTREEGKYRLDILGDNGYYCFTEEDIITIKKENSILIAIK